MTPDPTIPTNETDFVPPPPPPRVPLAPDEPKTLAEVFTRAVQDHPKPDALNYKREGEWRAISSADLLERAHLIALGLYALGLRPGDRAAILSESSPEWTLTDAGCQFASVIDVPIYPTQAPPQVRYILDDSGARVLFIRNREAFMRIYEAIDGAPALEHLIFFDEAGAEEIGASTLTQLIERGRELRAQQPELIEELARTAGAPDIATIIYTSGTTGEPKGVMLTHANLVSNLIDSSGHLAFSERDVALSVLPLSHVLERLGMYMYIHHGMSVYYAESIEKVGDNIREVRPTIMICVPRLFEKIYARIQEKACRRGQTEGRDTGVGCRRRQTVGRADGGAQSCAAAARFEVQTGFAPRLLEVARRDGRAHAPVRLRRRGPARRDRLYLSRRRAAYCAGLRFDGDFTRHRGGQSGRKSHRHGRATDQKRRSAHRRRRRDRDARAAHHARLLPEARRDARRLHRRRLV
jgi:acyl-CoA synthetase (AMP-forming)/AMP-acid ligase II